MESERYIAVAVRCAGGDGTEVSLALTIAGCIAGVTGIEVDIELIADRRVECSFDCLGASGNQGRINNWEVLQTVRSAVRILHIVWRYSVGAEINAQVRARAAVRIDRVATDTI